MRHSCSLTPGFQSTLPRGERLACVLINTGSYIFQSTLPRGERPPAPETSSVIASFQSTLPRGERPKAIGVDVSKIISIHAPTRGATSRRFHPSKKRNYFNPRSHEGSDKAISCKNKRKCKISIHAPTRGATDINLSGIVATEISIHAPTRGATPKTESDRKSVV